MKTLSKVMLGVAGTVAGGMMLTAAVYMTLVISEAKKNHSDDCDYLMVLGGNVIGEDTPSPQLFERMKAAAAYLNKNTECHIVPCGGCFRHGQKKSEAKIIADYLIEQGIDESRIILEDKSTTTVENFKFALEIIKNHSGKDVSETRIAFLSSDYHIYRAALIARTCGLENPFKVSCPTPKDAYKRYVRECFVAPDLFAQIIKSKFNH
ncbi:MAG: YdcF family protein [Ruminococcaceae bacterium]|nr:YdcF family protein [Oscillospiraceae bacterium]